MIVDCYIYIHRLSPFKTIRIVTLVQCDFGFSCLMLNLTMTAVCYYQKEEVFLTSDVCTSSESG